MPADQNAGSELAELLSGDAAALFDSLMACLPIGLTLAEPPDARILRVSDAGCGLLGRERESVEGISVAQYSEAYQVYEPLSGALATPETLPLARATLGGEVVRNEEWLLRTRAGSEITLLCNAGPIRNGIGDVIGGIVAWADISKQKALERELSEAVVARDRLLAELYHRIANHLLLVGAIVRSEARQCAEMSLLVDKVEQRLIASGRAYSALRGAIDGVSAAAFLSQICQPLRTERVGIELHADLGLALTAKHAPTLGIVVNEAVCNAMKHAFPDDRAGTIGVSLAQEHEHLVLRVADDGVGMEQGGKGSGQGQGLMLHLMKGIGGKVEISSSPGTGTIVTACWRP